MARPKRTKAQRELDLVELAKLMRRGYTQAKAALVLGVSQPQICYDWKILLERLKKEQIADTAILRARKIEELREVRSEAWEAWERSKQDRERRTCETSESESDGQIRTKETTQVEGRLPEDSYMRTVVMTLQEEARLDGSYTPEKHELTGKDGQPLGIKSGADDDPLNELKTEELHALRSIIDRLDREGQPKQEPVADTPGPGQTEPD